MINTLHFLLFVWVSTSIYLYATANEMEILILMPIVFGGLLFFSFSYLLYFWDVKRKSTGKIFSWHLIGCSLIVFSPFIFISILSHIK